MYTMCFQFSNTDGDRSQNRGYWAGLQTGRVRKRDHWGSGNVQQLDLGMGNGNTHRKNSDELYT